MFKLPLFTISLFYWWYLEVLGSLYAIAQSCLAARSGWSWWRSCCKHQTCASFRCTLVLSCRPSVFSGSCFQTVMGNSELSTLRLMRWPATTRRGVDFFFCLIMLLEGMRNINTLWLSAVHDYILLHGSSNDLVVALCHTPWVLGEGDIK